MRASRRPWVASRERHAGLAVALERWPAPAEPDAPAFVLVHGIGVSARYFRPLAAQLARSGHVLLVDLPGYGAAPNPRRPVSLADHAAALASVLRALDVPAPVLVGHSMGTQVVSVLAERHPDVTDTVVMMAPTMDPAARTPGRALARLLRDGLREPPRVLGIVVSDYLVRCGVPYLVRQLPNLLDDRLEDRVPRHRARTLVLAGDRDPVSPVAWARELAAAHPAAELRVVPGPHVVMHSAPAMVAQHITDFVAHSG